MSSAKTQASVGCQQCGNMFRVVPRRAPAGGGCRAPRLLSGAPARPLRSPGSPNLDTLITASLSTGLACIGYRHERTSCHEDAFSTGPGTAIPYGARTAVWNDPAERRGLYAYATPAKAGTGEAALMVRPGPSSLKATGPMGCLRQVLRTRNLDPGDLCQTSGQLLRSGGACPIRSRRFACIVGGLIQVAVRAGTSSAGTSA
jgi:hypothetical protein